ncbi:MAG: hypothetical protein II857_08855 [Selenomonadaceae bacterium]|nr:hypothetical protein [Selenomonadaceae bacterium]
MLKKLTVCATLDVDILILRDITAKAVINAIGLERAFNSVITKNKKPLSTPEEIF